MKRLLVSSLIITMSMTAMIGCATTDATDADTNVVKDEAVVANAKVKASDITGKVLEVKEDGKYILVDSDANMVKGQVWVSITDETNFFEDMPKDIAIGYRDVSRDFEVGNHVEIISTGEIAESYPMQATASAVCVNTAKMLNDSEEYDPQKHGIFKSGVIKEVDTSKSVLTLNGEDNVEYKVTLNKETTYVFTSLDKLKAGQEITVRAKNVEDGITDITATEIQLENDTETGIEIKPIEKDNK